MADSCGAETLANELFEALVAGEDFGFPEVDFTSDDFKIPSTEDNPLYGTVTSLTNDDLTQRKIDGEGSFDALMAALNVHLKDQYEKGRITGNDYAKAYVALTESALGNGVQFLLGRDQAYWQAVVAQKQAQIAEAEVVTARVKLEESKVRLQALKFEAKNQEASYALSKMKLATESIAYCSATYQLEQLLPAQLELTNEQIESARAQTSDTRRDGTTIIAGQMGKQKDLYDQQITSYQRDAEIKAAKVFSDAWTVMKTIDEGLLPPDGFTNASLDPILTTLKTNNNLI